MPKDEAAAAALAGGTPLITGKSWDVLYPPHLLGEAVKQIQGSSAQEDDTAALATTGESRDQQVQVHLQNQRHMVLLHTPPAPPPTPLTVEEKLEGRHAADEDGPLPPPRQQQQLPPLQPLQLQQLKLQQLRLLLSSPSERHSPQASPPHLVRFFALNVGVYVQAKLNIHTWDSPEASAAASAGAISPASAIAADGPCALAFLSGLPHAYSPTSQGSTAAPQTPQGELGFEAAALAIATAASTKEGTKATAYIDFSSNLSTSNSNEDACRSTSLPDEAFVTRLSSSAESATTAALVVATPGVRTPDGRMCWTEDALLSSCLDNSLSLSSNLGEPTSLDDSFSTVASAASVAASVANSSKESAGTSPGGLGCRTESLATGAPGVGGVGSLYGKAAEGTSAAGRLDVLADLPLLNSQSATVGAPEEETATARLNEPLKLVSGGAGAKRMSLLLPRIPPCLPPLVGGWDRAWDRSHLTSLLITLPLNFPFGRILKFGSGGPGAAAAPFAPTSNNGGNNNSSQSLGVKKSYYIFSPSLHPAAHMLFSHAGGICDTFAASLQMELAIIYVPSILVPLVAAAFNTLGEELLPQLQQPLKLRCWGLQERNAPGRFGGKVLTVSCSVEGEEERRKFEKLQAFLRNLETYVEGLLRSYGQQQQQADGKRSRTGEGATPSSGSATGTSQGKTSCCRRQKGTAQQQATQGKKNNIWRYSVVGTPSTSDATDPSSSNSGSSNSSGCLDLTIRAFETRPLDRPVKDFAGCAVEGICTSEIRLVTTRAIHGMTCEIDPRFRRYSIGTRPILQTPSGVLCRHCIAPQLLPDVWEAHLRSGVSSARDQQKKLTETCVIAHIERRPLAKRAYLLESLGRLGVPLWVNGEPRTQPAVEAAEEDSDSVASGTAAAGGDQEVASNAQLEAAQPKTDARQQAVLQQMSLLGLDPSSELQHQQQQSRLYGDGQDPKQSSRAIQQQSASKTVRTSRHQQRKGQLARVAQQQPKISLQLAASTGYQGPVDERELSLRTAAVNTASAGNTEASSVLDATAVSMGGRAPSQQLQKQRPTARPQLQQQDQLLLFSGTSTAEEQFLCPQQQQLQGSEAGTDLLRAMEVEALAAAGSGVSLPPGYDWQHRHLTPFAHSVPASMVLESTPLPEFKRRLPPPHHQSQHLWAPGALVEALSLQQVCFSSAAPVSARVRAVPFPCVCAERRLSEFLALPFGERQPGSHAAKVPAICNVLQGDTHAVWGPEDMQTAPQQQYQQLKPQNALALYNGGATTRGRHANAAHAMPGDTELNELARGAIPTGLIARPRGQERQRHSKDKTERRDLKYLPLCLSGVSTRDCAGDAMTAAAAVSIRAAASGST
ncbi:hypothetical protein cyc_06174 [Cyclospora cayetanensis]|uniref:Uncharacterized protein n=1 Tax=Cyclospora cayetanensis TaxID=88456 RepID=A0A1D3D7F3_9EIME|nr:hypothetical protein cyc_06174 [Cyclospora cayetanensis]